MRLKQTKKKIILFCCVELASDNHTEIRRASRITNGMWDRSRGQGYFDELAAYRLKEATMGLLQPQEIDGNQPTDKELKQVCRCKMYTPYKNQTQL